MNKSGRLELAGLRILVVDDDEDVRDLLVTMLEFYGAEVKAASGAQSAMVIYRGFSPDLLLTDLCMPGGDGCSLLQQMRSEPSLTGTPLAAVASSAFVGPENESSALAAGFQAFLPKPLDLGTLLHTVGRVTSGQR